MPNFDSLFYDVVTDTHKPNILYKGKITVRADRLSIFNICKIKIHIVSTNSEWKQGIRLNVDRYFTVEGKRLGKKLIIWENTANADMIVDVHSRDGKLLVYNAWDRGDGMTDAWRHGAAMIIEEVPNGRRYYCNDGHLDDNFDDIVFEITVLP